MTRAGGGPVCAGRVRRRVRTHNPTDLEEGARHHGVMMTLYFTGQSVLLADDVCDALLRYAQALADTQSSDVVSVPVLTADGESIMAEFLLGPASQLYATVAGDDVGDHSHAGVVDELARRTRMLHPAAVIVRAEDTPPVGFDPDLGQ